MEQAEESHTETENSVDTCHNTPVDHDPETWTDADLTPMQDEAYVTEADIDDENDKDYEDEVDQDDQSHMPRAGWSEDTVQTEAMARLGICINIAAKVLVCIACASAIKPLDLPGHLLKTHPPITTCGTFCQELTESYDLRIDLDSRPGSVITAIYGLDLKSGYNTCVTCGYACKSDKTMSRHLKQSEHCKTTREGPAQTFRSSSKRNYFGVNLEPEREAELSETSLDPLTYLKKKFPPTPFCDIPIKPPKTPRDANHFLDLEKWDIYVEGRTGAQISHAIREREPELRREVRFCVERFATDVATRLGKVDHEVRAAMADYIG